MKAYLKNNFDGQKMADMLDEFPIWAAPFGLKLLDYIDYKRGISALDIGFGTGFPLTELAMRLGETAKIYGIDPWKEAIERAKKKIDYYQIKNIELIEGVAESIPLPDKSTDLIVSNNGINNVQDVEQVFAECARILKKGGQFVLTMNTDKSMFEFYDTLKAVLLEMGLHKEVSAVDRHIAEKRPSIESFTGKLRNSGFLIKDVEVDQFNYIFANGTAMLNHYFIRLAFMDSWIKLLPANHVSEIFDKIECRLNEQSDILGRLKLSIPFVLINAIKR